MKRNCVSYRVNQLVVRFFLCNVLLKRLKYSTLSREQHRLCNMSGAALPFIPPQFPHWIFPQYITYRSHFKYRIFSRGIIYRTINTSDCNVRGVLSARSWNGSPDPQDSTVFVHGNPGLKLLKQRNLFNKCPSLFSTSWEILDRGNSY